MSDPVISDLRLRAYFASVIGAVRAPFGQKAFKDFPAAGRTLELAQNSTKDRVIRLSVSRADVTGLPVSATFTQTNGAASSNDFAVLFVPTASFPFVLYPGESLSLQSNGPAAMQVVTAQETY